MTRPCPSPSRPSSRLFLALVLAPTLVLWACQEAEGPSEGTGEGGAAWLSGSVDERFQRVGDQLAGFSGTMWEVAYRYEEAHWAVQDGNWPYAHYQAEKLQDAMERGVVRRPAREASARTLFLDGPLPAFLDVLEGGQVEEVEEAWGHVVDACNACHVAEAVPFIRVTAPEERSSFVRPENPSQP